MTHAEHHRERAPVGAPRKVAAPPPAVVKRGLVVRDARADFERQHWSAPYSAICTGLNCALARAAALAARG